MRMLGIQPRAAVLGEAFYTSKANALRYQYIGKANTQGMASS